MLRTEVLEVGDRIGRPDVFALPSALEPVPVFSDIGDPFRVLAGRILPPVGVIQLSGVDFVKPPQRRIQIQTIAVSEEEVAELDMFSLVLPQFIALVRLFRIVLGPEVYSDRIFDEALVVNTARFWL